ncbi:hypothetical protein KR044_010216, partial [Drosophila immigrans]
VYLGIDFWRSFGLLNQIVQDTGVVNELDVGKDNPESPKMHILTKKQQIVLNEVISKLPSFEKEGLGRTHVIEHSIDVGEAKPIKQRHWPVSPAKERLMFSEIEHMLALDVIEESKSPWSSNCVLVITFLGHKCTDKGILPDDKKYDIIKNYPVPHDADSARRFVASCNYYRPFINNFADYARHITRLCKKNVKFEFDCQHAFDHLKSALINPNLLQYPDFSKEFCIITDASKEACGGVLTQNKNGLQ